MAEAAAGLGTVDKADPERLLRRALDVLLSVGEAEEALFFRLASGPEQPMTARFLHVGSERARRALERFHEKPPIAALRRLGSSAWEPSRITPGELGDFVERRLLFGDREWQESALFAEYLAPGDLADQQRLLVAHGRHVVGWIGLFRRSGAPMFAREDRRHLRPLVGPMAATVVTAARLDALGPDVPADLVVRPDGGVEFASADAKPWLGFRGFTDALRRRIVDLDRGLAPDPVFVLDGVAEARTVRLDGGGGVRYLVSVRPPTPLSIPELATSLTPAEREVAELAASGASTADIARLRATRIGTVKNQLKRIYRALGVSNRIELAQTLEA